MDNLSLADACARSLSVRLPPRVDIADLQQDAALGLIRAVPRYDKSKQASLATYAIWRINGTMLDGLRQRDDNSRSQRQQGNERTAASLSEIDPDECPELMQRDTSNIDDRDWFERITRGLCDRDRMILRLRFFDDLTLGEIATRTRHCEARISGLLVDALKFLRDKLNQIGTCN